MNTPEPVFHCPGCKGFTPAWDECHGDTLEVILARYARCNLDSSAPMHPRDQAVLRDFGAFLAARHEGAKGLHWKELMAEGTESPYWLEWYCPQPAPGQEVTPTRFEWIPDGGDGFPVRRVYAWREDDAAPDRASRDDTDRDGHARPAASPGAPASSAEAEAAGAGGAGEVRPAGAEVLPG